MYKNRYVGFNPRPSGGRSVLAAMEIVPESPGVQEVHRGDVREGDTGGGGVAGEGEWEGGSRGGGVRVRHVFGFFFFFFISSAHLKR